MAKIFTPSKGKNRKHKSKAKQLANFNAEITAYDPKGKAIAKNADGRIVFVEGALTGETVLVKPEKYTDTVIHGQTIEVIESSEKRAEPECKHFAQCGGCQLQYMSASEQLDAKKQGIDNLLKKHLGLEVIPWQDNIESDSWHYRRVSRLAIWHPSAKQVDIGFRQPKSKLVVDVDACLILPAKVMALVNVLKPVLTGLKDKKLFTHLQSFYLSEQATLILRATGNVSSETQSVLTNWAQQQNCNLMLELSEKQYQVLHKYEATALPVLSYQWQDIDFQFMPDNFIQVNDSVNEQMIKQAIDWLAPGKDDVVLDLFSGMGNFTLPLAKLAKQVIAVEGVNTMVKQLLANAEHNGIKNVSAHQADLSTIDDKRKPQWLKPIDKLLLDPARDGAFDVVKKIPILKPETILYISCEPTTMQRDLKVLLTSGYSLTKFCLLNMFPHTQHAEAMALLEKR